MKDKLLIANQEFLVYSPVDYPYNQIPTEICRKGKKGKSARAFYCDFGAFDIETTSEILERDPVSGEYIRGRGYMYIWQFYTSAGLCMGRTWQEFEDFLQGIRKHFLGVGTDYTYIIYVHNLSFEFAFLAGIMDYFGHPTEVFAVRSRRVLSYKIKDLHIEFRDSLRLTNRSLKKYLHDIPGCPYEKMVGDLDYTIRRTPETELTEAELVYCAVDVIGLYDALRRDMRITGDNTASIPLTSTGYVRREFKELLKDDRHYHNMLTAAALNPIQFDLVRRLAMGGDTLACMCNEIGHIHRGVLSYDYKSQYPSMLVLYPYPSGRLEYEGADLGDDDLLAIENDGRYYITEVIFEGLELRDYLTPIPALHTWKCDYITGHSLEYNGRLCCADECGVALDMVTMQIVRRQYRWKRMITGRTYSCDYEPIPEKVRQYIIHMFAKKCELDKIRKRIRADPNHTQEELENAEMNYSLYKNKFNAIYGMFYTSPLHDNFVWIPEESRWADPEDPEEVEKYHLDKPLDDPKVALELFKNQVQGAGPYLYGVHTAALGRKALSEMIDAAGPTMVIYSDTDSIKCRDFPDVREAMEEFNRGLIELAREKGAYWTDPETGEITYMGIAENETASGAYQEFVSQGAKKYCYRDAGGTLHMTLSGVEKEQVVQLDDDISNFEKGKVFSPAGGIMLHYYDSPAGWVQVEGDDGTKCTILSAGGICCTSRVITLGYINDSYHSAYPDEFRELWDIWDMIDRID